MLILEELDFGIVGELSDDYRGYYPGGDAGIIATANRVEHHEIATYGILVTFRPAVRPIRD